MKTLIKLFAMVVGIFTFGFVYAQVDSTGSGPSLVDASWQVWVGALVPIVIIVLRIVARAVPTDKDRDYIGIAINYIPVAFQYLVQLVAYISGGFANNAKTDGNTHPLQQK